MTFPIDAVRAQFPSLATTDGGQRRIYFDNAAGTRVPPLTISESKSDSLDNSAAQAY